MTTEPWIDPIVEEVRARREELYREANYDLETFVQRIIENQERHGDQIVNRETIGQEELRRRLEAFRESRQHAAE